MTMFNIVFLDKVLMGACCVILAHVTWAFAREWAFSIRTAKTVTWALTREWTLARDIMLSFLVEG